MEVKGGIKAQFMTQSAVQTAHNSENGVRDNQ